MTSDDDFDDLGFQNRLRQLEEARLRARQLLGVEEGAGQDTVRAAFRRRAAACHPDTHPDQPDATDHFRRLCAARDLLLWGRFSDDLVQDEVDGPQARQERYNTDNAWGHFLWWRRKFFSGFDGSDS